MRLVGYCEKCHKTKQVTVTSSALQRWMARGKRGALVGICASCEETRR